MANWLVLAVSVVVAALMLGGFFSWLDATIFARLPKPPRVDVYRPSTPQRGRSLKELFAMTDTFDNLIELSARQFDLDPGLLKAVIKVESDFDPNAHRHEPYVHHLEGPDNSFGLMQILESTARSVGYVGPAYNLYHPAVNIYYGAKYLKQQLDRYDGDEQKAIAAYNAGSVRYRKLPGNQFEYTNQSYVDKVNEAREAL